MWWRDHCSLLFVYLQVSPPRPSYPWSSHLFPSRPLTAGMATWFCHESIYILASGYFSFHTKWVTRYTTWNSAPWEDSPSSLSLRAIPEWGCSTVRFRLAPPVLTDLFANQAWAFPCAFILPSLVISWGRGADATVAGLFVPSAPVCAWFWMYAPSTLPWIVAGPTQTYAGVGLAEPSLRWAVPATWLFAAPWPCLPYLPGPSSTPGIAFQRHVILHYRWHGLAPEPQRPALWFSQCGHKLFSASFPTNGVGFAELYGPCSRTACTAVWNCWGLSHLSHAHSWQPFVQLYKWAAVIFLAKDCTASWARGGPPVFYFGWMSWNSPDRSPKMVWLW